MNVAVAPDTETVPGTLPAPSLKVNDPAGTLTPSLNVTVKSTLTGTPGWVSDGLTELTLGPVESAAEVVANVHVRFAAR
jgi:hypothetical protein